ncbi:hypothetical protein [Candidatus Electronema sp. PJ]|uniref:hypothetical protein n=1 Tax=Candidatus Electronema sp. PJ TaxID=3401572 RepID=UPI003AA8857E
MEPVDFCFLVNLEQRISVDLFLFAKEFGSIEEEFCQLAKELYSAEEEFGLAKLLS